MPYSPFILNKLSTNEIINSSQEQLYSSLIERSPRAENSASYLFRQLKQQIAPRTTTTITRQTSGKLVEIPASDLQKDSILFKTFPAESSDNASSALQSGRIPRILRLALENINGRIQRHVKFDGRMTQKEHIQIVSSVDSKFHSGTQLTLDLTPEGAVVLAALFSSLGPSDQLDLRTYFPSAPMSREADECNDDAFRRMMLAGTLAPEKTEAPAQTSPANLTEFLKEKLKEEI